MIDPPHELSVRDLMTTRVHTLGPQANLDEVSDLMRIERIRHGCGSPGTTAKS